MTTQTPAIAEIEKSDSESGFSKNVDSGSGSKGKT